MPRTREWENNDDLELLNASEELDPPSYADYRGSRNCNNPEPFNNTRQWMPPSKPYPLARASASTVPQYGEEIWSDSEDSLPDLEESIPDLEPPTRNKPWQRQTSWLQENTYPATPSYFGGPKISEQSPRPSLPFGAILEDANPIEETETGILSTKPSLTLSEAKSNPMTTPRQATFLTSFREPFFEHQQISRKMYSKNGCSQRQFQFKSHKFPIPGVSAKPLKDSRPLWQRDAGVNPHSWRNRPATPSTSYSLNKCSESILVEKFNPDEFDLEGREGHGPGPGLGLSQMGEMLTVGNESSARHGAATFSGIPASLCER